MLVCHCNVISEAEIENQILAFLYEDPWQIIVPAKVYRELGKRGRCCGCFPNVVDIITRVTENFHDRSGAHGAETGEGTGPARDEGDRHEGRRAGHRAA